MYLQFYYLSINNPNNKIVSTFYSVFSKNIYSLIMKERGDSLYKLIKVMLTFTEKNCNDRAIDNM